MKQAIVLGAVACSVCAGPMEDAMAAGKAAGAKAAKAATAGGADMAAAMAAGGGDMKAMVQAAAKAALKMFNDQADSVQKMSDTEVFVLFSNPAGSIKGMEAMLDGVKKTAKQAKVEVPEIAVMEKKVALMKATFKSYTELTKGPVADVAKAMVAEVTAKVASLDAAKLKALSAKIDCAAVAKKVSDPTIEAQCGAGKKDDKAGRAFLGSLWLRSNVVIQICMNRKASAAMQKDKNMYADQAATIGAMQKCVADLSGYFPEAVFPKELYTLTAPTTKAVEAEAKKIAAAAGKSGSAFVVASGAALAAFALF